MKLNLDRTLSFNDLLSWRLYWLAWRVLLEVAEQLHRVSTVAEADQMAENIRGNYNRVLQKTGIGYDTDMSQYDVEKQIQEHPKFIEYRDWYNEAKEELLKIHQRICGNQIANFSARL